MSNDTSEISYKLFDHNQLGEGYLNILSVMHVFLWLNAIADTYNADESLGFKAYRFSINTLCLLFTIYNRYQSYNELNYQFSSAKEEVEKANEIQRQIKNSPKCDVILSADKPDLVTIKVKLSSQKQDTEVSWRLGKGELLSLTNELTQINDQIKNNLDVMDIIKSSWGAPATPYFMQYFYKFKPNLARYMDASSKARIFGFYFYAKSLFSEKSGIVYNSLSSSLPIIKNTYAYLACQTLALASLIGESYLLNKYKTNLSLEGYKEINKDYSSWPPTCFGQQATMKFGLFPNNSYIKAAATYLVEGYNNLNFLKKRNLLSNENVPDELLNKISHFLSSFQTNQGADEEVIKISMATA